MAQMFVDPPQGWRFGFPKIIPQDIEDHREWLIENGYPEALMDEYGEHFYCRYWIEPDKGEQATLMEVKK